MSTDLGAYHKPDGDPCSRCNKPAIRHRVRHTPDGDPCTCGLPAKNHRIRSPGEKRTRNTKPAPLFMGVDGEGQGRNPHRYYLLCASDATGQHVCGVENPEGLSTIECFEFFLNLPRRARTFAYSFNYDLTKIFRDLPDAAVGMLARPDKRRGKHGLRAITWNGYRINLLATKFTLEHRETKRRRVIWDIWKFFRGKFVSALQDWKIKTDVDRITEMKEKRAQFDKESPDAIRAYCFEECRCLAVLVAKLIQAHIDAKLPLKAYFGAGSTASALLDRFDIKERRGESPDRMQEAIASAFFGGRFEHIVVGPIAGPVYSYDISSAYPYQLCFLPCLEHGVWRHTHSYKEMVQARHACVRYKLYSDSAPDIWGPFPFRLEDGTIIFPGISGGGWVWRDEFMSAIKLFANVEFISAWVFDSDCDCGSPFKDIPSTYKARLALGKDAAGIVLKLGMNSVYGKLAQSSGSAPYQSWIWAGMVTSGTRAQLLDFLNLHTDHSNMLMVATDGVYTKERIQSPVPRDTGTFDTPKPLGGWEEKILHNGVFAARPGVYFPNNPSKEDLAQFRARGLSKSVLVAEHERIVAAYHKGEPEVGVPAVTRFVGMKSGTLQKRDGTWKRTESCGEWVERQIRLTFDSLPKRAQTVGQSLTIRNVEPDAVSLPYKRSLLSEEASELRRAQEEADEQPDGGDFTDYEES